MTTRSSLQAILEQGLVRRIKDAGQACAPAANGSNVIPTGIPDLDATLPAGGLARGMTHEWVLDELSPKPQPEKSRWRQEWRPPLLLLTWLAARSQGLCVWVGRRCWPCPWTLMKAGIDPVRCLMIDPREEERAWAIDQALRCPGVGAVVGDVEGMDMADSRRLQLAAEAGQTLGLLTRPAPEIKLLSASGTRWVVRPEPGASDRVRWKVELRRCKAAALWSAASGGSVREWVLEWDERRRGVQVVGVVEEDQRETGGVHLAADVAHRPGPPKVRLTA